MAPQDGQMPTQEPTEQKDELRDCSNADTDLCHKECSGAHTAEQLGIRCLNPAKGGSTMGQDGPMPAVQVEIKANDESVIGETIAKAEANRVKTLGWSAFAAWTTWLIVSLWFVSNNGFLGMYEEAARVEFYISIALFIVAIGLTTTWMGYSDDMLEPLEGINNPCGTLKDCPPDPESCAERELNTCAPRVEFDIYMEEMRVPLFEPSLPTMGIDI